MTPSQPSPAHPPPELPCAICGTPTSITILRRPVCDECCARATDTEVRLYRLSLRVIQGGLRG